MCSIVNTACLHDLDAFLKETENDKKMDCGHAMFDTKFIFSGEIAQRPQNIVEDKKEEIVISPVMKRKRELEMKKAKDEAKKELINKRKMLRRI